MAGVLNDTGPSQVCGTRPPAREPTSTLFTTVMMQVSNTF